MITSQIDGINDIDLSKALELVDNYDEDKEGFIKDTLECGVPMRIGRFLVPEFAAYLGVTIDDLKRLSGIIEKIDEKHLYEKVIYDAYLENGEFKLTEEQRVAAYKEYLKRKQI
jgi:hypothetical protein